MSTRKYYSLAVHCTAGGEPDNGTGWGPEYGSYDRRDVVDEMQGALDDGFRRRSYRILTTGEMQADIDAAIAALNATDPQYVPR